MKQPVILLALGSYQHDTHRGVARYAREQGWHLVTEMAYGGVIPKGWEGDGIVTALTERQELTDFVLETNVPTVDLNLVRADIPLPRVVGNHEAIGQLAALHFIERGFEHFAWYAVHENRTALERRTGFLRTLNDHGLSLGNCTNLIWDQDKQAGSLVADRDWTERRDWLVRALSSSEKPLGVFAYNDYEASHLINACLHAGLAIPEDIAVVGVDNDELVCDCLPVPLSSVKHNLESRGYQGAKLLHDRIRNPDTPIPEPTRIDPVGVITRKSSDILALPDPQVGKALRMIWDRYHESISVTDVVEATDVSRRTLEKAFTQHLGRSILDEIQRVRLKRVRELLANSNRSMREIAEQTGFASAQYLHQVFRQHVGVTPGDYRAKHAE